MPLGWAGEAGCWAPPSKRCVKMAPVPLARALALVWPLSKRATPLWAVFFTAGYLIWFRVIPAEWRETNSLRVKNK